MSAFYPFRGGGLPKADIVRFFYRFSYMMASLTIEFSMDVMRFSVVKYLIIAIVFMIQTIGLSMDPEKRCLLVSWFFLLS